MFAALRSAEWSHMRDYVSGAFFDVLPGPDLAKEVAKLSRNMTRRRAFDTRRDVLAAAWVGRTPTVSPVGALRGASVASLQTFDDETRTAIGDATLAAFFRVVLEGGDVLLDLRPSRLAWSNGALEWSPSRLWTTWDAEFAQHVAGLYRGFYGDDDAVFDQALAGLGISSARDVLRAHFGAENQHAVAFELEKFHATFHEVFVSCRDSGASLHPGFVTLGLLLACLYETLELLGGTFDVRAAYEGCVARGPS